MTTTWHAILAAALLLSGCQRVTDDAASKLTAVTENAPAASSNDLAAAPKGDWPLFRGDSLANGIADSTLPDELEVLWKFNSKQHGFEATAAIVDGLVFA